MRGVDIAREIIFNNLSGKILLIGDPDIDGMMALRILCEYFSGIGVQYQYHINDNRQHGFLLDAERLRGYLIVSADFAMTYEEIRDVVDKGINIVCTDHHEVQDEFIDYENNGYRGIVINNQYPFEPEDIRYDSGAGVIYSVLKELSPEFESEERDSIVGITLLSDLRPIENKKAKRMLAKLYSNREGYIDYLVQSTHKVDYTFGEPRMDRTYVDFTFSPTINAMLRYNKTQEALALIFGYGLVSTVDYRQMQAELVARMKEVAEIMVLDNMTAIGVQEDYFEEDITNFIGLLCMKYNEDKSTLGFVYSGGTVSRASFRGKFSNIDYNKNLQLLGVHSAGHKSAFGIKEFKPSPKIWNQINSMIGELEENVEDTRVIIESSNLSVTIGSKGSHIAHDNCFVRTSHRTYIKYTGKNYRVVRETYKMRELTEEELDSGIKPDKVQKGAKCVYVLDSNGEKVVKYQEYMIDNRMVKSFGVTPVEGLIMPIMEKGYIYLYLV